jgi:hypothetical protein
MEKRPCFGIHCLRTPIYHFRLLDYRSSSRHVLTISKSPFKLCTVCTWLPQLPGFADVSAIAGVLAGVLAVARLLCWACISVIYLHEKIKHTVQYFRTGILYRTGEGGKLQYRTIEYYMKAPMYQNVGILDLHAEVQKR